MHNKCYNCLQEGHISKKCNKSKSFFCYNCSNQGHIAINCYYSPLSNYPGSDKYGFLNSKGLKSTIHNIFKKNTDYYPESILLNIEKLHNKKYIKKFMNNKKAFVLKKNASTSGEHVKLVFNFAEIKETMEDWYFNNDENNKIRDKIFILQTPIDPYLINGQKFDCRIHILFIKEHNSYKALYMPNTYIRFSAYKYNPLNMEGFLTNISILPEFALKEYKKYVMSLETFVKKYKVPIIEEKLLNISKICCKKYLQYLLTENEKFYYEKITPMNQLFIAGFDIIFDKYLNPYLLEINNGPDLIGPPDNSDPERTLKLNKMLEKIHKNVLVKWEEQKQFELDDYFIEFA